MAPSPNTNPTKVTVGFDTGLKRDIGKLSLLFTGVGAIIGSGWLFGALYASQIAGPASLLSWIAGAIMVAIIGLVYAELASMFPVAGGVIRFPHYAFGSFASFSSGWISWLSAAAVTPVEVLASIQYALPYAPWLMHPVNGVPVLTAAGFAVAVALIFVYSLVNIMGVKLFARFNNVLVWWKLAVIALTIITLFSLQFEPGNLTTHGFAPNGWSAIFVAIPAAGIAFSFIGFRNAVEYAGESSHPQRDIPFAVIMSIIITAIIYVLLQLAFMLALPDDLLNHGWPSLSFAEDAGPLAGLAIILGGVWLGWLLRVDAIISPADTGLIYAGVTSRLSYANARNRNAPQWLTKINSHGVPWLSVIVMFLVGCIFFLPFPSWQLFIGFITSAFAISFGAGPVAVGALRRALPDQERPFTVPGGDILPILSLMVSSLLVLWCGWGINEKMLIALIIGYIVYIAYHLTARIELPPLDLKSGAWFPVWVIGLVIISNLTDLDGDGQIVKGIFINGGAGPLNMLWGCIVCVLFSIAVYYMGVALRLPSDRMARYIHETPTDEPPADD